MKLQVVSQQWDVREMIDVGLMGGLLTVDRLKVTFQCLCLELWHVSSVEGLKGITS